MADLPFVAAAAQLTSKTSIDENLTTCARLAADAAARKAKLLVLPECFAFIGETIEARHAIAERLDTSAPGPILKALVEIAKTYQMWIVAGGLPEATDEVGPELAYNTCLVLSPAGEITCRYRKIHLFDVDIPGKAQFKESSFTTAGEDVVVAETALAKLGLTICYDVRFPELYRKLASQGAQILLVPAAFTAHTGEAHWHTLLRARAIENQCFVIAAGQVGQHNKKRETYGHSLIIDPWGETLAECKQGVGLAVAEVDPGRLSAVRERMPCHQHRVL